MRKDVIAEGITVYLGDMQEVLSDLGIYDAAVTDPPYGIGADKNAANAKGQHGWTYYGDTNWDESRPPRECFDLILKHSNYQIIWGGNYFTDYLPPTMQWLVWDKMQRDFSLADCEIAWSSQMKAARVLSYPRAQALKDVKQHPTQKPIKVMTWCIDQLPQKEVKTIIDPFMGSGTTGVAAIRMCKSFCGIERDKKYYDIARRRIEKELARPDLFYGKATRAKIISDLFRNSEAAK